MARTAVDFGAAREQVTLEQVSQYGPIIGLVGLYAAFTLLNDRFLTVGNQVNVLQQVSIIGIMAIGVTFPILCAEIDLSIAQVMEVCGLTIATLAVGARLFEGVVVPVPAAILVGVLLGATFGAVSGFVTARFGVPSFMTTLAMLFLADGLGLIVSGNRPIIGLPPSLTGLGGSRVFGFPSIVIVFLSLLVFSQLLLSYTKFGLYIYAIGGDRQSAERMGINVRLVRLGTLVISGAFAAIAGLVTLGRLGSAIPTMGSGLLLPPIAAVILGGANLFGGSGNMVGTLIGVLILGILQNGLNLMGVGPSGQLVAQGIVLMLAVLANVVGQE
ncbi:MULTISPECIES: ABC transporter permease [Haloarcula]|uniref:ABC transporter permease n=1 Tax=Haloarcula pellucida TaxID=1427151 RepID=A0A830GGZ7_9EURY|nr:MULTISPECIES: ABC transporter permease [Halomicroarcula]MBX0347412.1 ABC transporter permease [Halomicroarcula pellucida]MDS0276713.1 ABC transporter permease [Halomicroarcula sp. S1AR25-4]GGN88535.1 ABC transporter permease [Halomicroarcula pellucida]